MSHIHIRCAEENDATVIMFPVPEDGHLMMDDLRSAFPSLTSLRFIDGGEEKQHHILCRNDIFVEPAGGWKKSGRIFLAVNQHTGNGATRFGLFESYRTQLATRQRNPNTPPRRKTTVQKRNESSTAMMTIGHGQFRAGRFTKITSSNLSGCGGIVVVGPFEKTGNTVEDLKNMAFMKFQQQNSSFRRKYKNSKQFMLLYPDGSPVAKLPDKSEEFSIEGYRNFIDPMKRFDRLRLYICETVLNVCYRELSCKSTGWTSSSSDDDLPTLRTPTSTESTLNSNIGTTSVTDDDDTLPLSVEVTFHSGDTTFVETFPNNASGSTILEYAAEKMETSCSFLEITLDSTHMKLKTDDRLMDISTTSALHVCVSKTANSKTPEEPCLDDAISACHFKDDTEVATALVRQVLSRLDTSEPKAIMGAYVKQFHQGRPLDIQDESEVVVGETSPIFVNRHDSLFSDAFEEVEHLENIRFPMEVNYYGEFAQDYGGPRKEFLHDIINQIKKRMLSAEDGLVRLAFNEEFLARSRYFYAGVFIGLSALQGGPYAEFLVGVLTNTPPGEEIEQLRRGLSRTGIAQLMAAKSTIKYLFTPSSSTTLNVNKLLQIFQFELSEEGSNRRTKEEAACREFTRYVRDVYGGRRPGVTLEHILKFATGASSIPLLGFTLQPKIDFADMMFPTASTCVNHMTIPLENMSSDNMDMGFMNDFFGLE